MMMMMNAFVRQGRALASPAALNARSLATLTANTMNENITKARYEVRGDLPILAEKIKKELKAGGHSYPFEHVVEANIGNPQALQQKPITFFRQVLSLLELNGEVPAGMESFFNKDVVERAKTFLDAPAGIGAYSGSTGHEFARQEVAAFIDRRDGNTDAATSANPDHIILTTGASEGIALLLEAIIANPNVGIMIPIPQYPLYTATITLNNGHAVDYYLDEDDNWSLSVDDLKKSVDAARAKGVDVRALVVINPGNPTGQCLTREAIENVIQFCHDEKLIIFADEVYQENIYNDKFPFHSFRKVLMSMPQCKDSVEIASFHSLSKGMIGECGRRGGFCELVNFDPDVVQQINKRVSISLCSNVAAQVMVSMMCNPPQPGDESYDLYTNEIAGIKASLKRRATKLANFFNNLDGISCHEPMGAMYLFPRVEIPQRAIDEAATKGIAADTLYCMDLLKATGLCVVPGSGFGQKEGTYHFRCTILPPESQLEDITASIKAFHDKWMSKYNDN